MNIPATLQADNIEAFIAGVNTMSQKSVKELDKQTELVEEFNAANQIGIEVDVKKDDGSIDRTRTRSEAWLMGTHTAMIILDGFPGGYML
ncbi:hypothetical protein KAR91_37205 [Candidatus Pacearchaeota archaeon]|nr:hypothetical protein [Candidatus Pacearchaeota archaeon]